MPATKARKRDAPATNVKVAEELTGEAVPRSSNIGVISKIPLTNGKFWLTVMGKRTYSIADIVERAIQRLDVAEEVRPVLTNRLSTWLYPALRAGKLQYGGVKGRTKR